MHISSRSGKVIKRTKKPAFPPPPLVRASPVPHHVSVYSADPGISLDTNLDSMEGIISLAARQGSRDDSRNSSFSSSLYTTPDLGPPTTLVVAPSLNSPVPSRAGSLGAPPVWDGRRRTLAPLLGSAGRRASLDPAGGVAFPALDALAGPPASPRPASPPRVDPSRDLLPEPASSLPAVDSSAAREAAAVAAWTAPDSWAVKGGAPVEPESSDEDEAAAEDEDDDEDGLVEDASAGNVPPTLLADPTPLAAGLLSGSAGESLVVAATPAGPLGETAEDVGAAVGSRLALRSPPGAGLARPLTASGRPGLKLGRPGTADANRWGSKPVSCPLFLRGRDSRLDFVDAEGNLVYDSRLSPRQFVYHPPRTSGRVGRRFTGPARQEILGHG